MSAKLMGLVFELEIPLKPKMVLLKYADHADPDGCNAWPSVKTVARGCSIPERTTARIIKTLKALGILQPDGHGFGGRKERPKGQSYRIDLETAPSTGPERWKKAYAKIIKEGAETSASHVAEVSGDKRLPFEAKRMPIGTETSANHVADKPFLEPSLEPITKSPDGDLSAPTAAPASVRDLKSRIFGEALNWLSQQSGRPKEKLRSMVGRWCRDHGDGRVLEAMTQAARCGPVDPVPWIEQALKDESDGKRRGSRDDLTAGQAAAAGCLGRDLRP